jgi:RNA polymerase sigma-70 factor, ECF subfamily
LEKEIVLRAQNGDVEAMRILYESSFDKLYRFIRFKVNSDSDAEDIVAEAFTKAFEKIRAFQFRSSFKTYVYTIAKNLLFDFYKKSNNEVSIDEGKINEIFWELDDSASTGRSSKLMLRVRELMRNLNQKENDVITLRFISGMSVEDVASALHLSPSNVKVIAHRAIAKLREMKTDD